MVAQYVKMCKKSPIFFRPFPRQGRQGRRAALALVALVAWCACHVDHVEAVDVSLFPPCQASSIPPVAGYVSQNNLVLDAGGKCWE